MSQRGQIKEDELNFGVVSKHTCVNPNKEQE